MGRTKKPRRITIAGVEYRWHVTVLDPHIVLLAVWLARLGRGGQQLRVRVRFDDPWINWGPLLVTPVERVADLFVLRPLTPGAVRRIIEAALDTGWHPVASGAPVDRAWTADGRVVARPEGREGE